MPRKPRIYLPGIPCHVIQRGTNREACFYTEDDYLFYLECLGSAAKRDRVDIHAYVLMTNHVHLLMTPQKAEGISRVMQSVGGLPVVKLSGERLRERKRPNHAPRAISQTGTNTR